MDKARHTYTLLTLIAVEVAGDVDALASHHHHLVSYNIKK